MIHYTCDQCRCGLDAEHLRYVVRIEAHLALDACGLDAPDSDDDVAEIAELLTRTESEPGESLEDELHMRRRFDLCEACYRTFARAPWASPVGHAPR